MSDDDDDDLPIPSPLTGFPHITRRSCPFSLSTTATSSGNSREKSKESAQEGFLLKLTA